MISTGAPCVYSLRSSFSMRGQLQHVPKVIITSPHSKLTAAKAAPEHQLLDWSFEEAEQHPREQHTARGRQPDRPSTRQQYSDQQQPDQTTTTIKQQQNGRKSEGLRQDPAASSNGSVRRTRRGSQDPSTLQQHRQQAMGPSAALRTPQQLSMAGNQSHVQDSAVTEADEYAAAQQRVRQLLISADIRNPLATADQIPDTVNDIVTALQIVATAAKPAKLHAIKQYQWARQQLTAAVVHKLKQLLLNSAKPADTSTSLHNKQPVAQTQEQQQQQQHPTTVERLAASAAALPPTKLAAATFALGVLRYYDTDLVPALAAAALHIIRCSNKRHHSSDGTPIAGQITSQPGVPIKHRAAAADSDQEPQKQQSQQNKSLHKPQTDAVQHSARFNANQLGQLAQGFVYLDHHLSPDWQEEYLTACRQQFKYMRGQQLASLAEFLMHYRNHSSSSSSIIQGAGILLDSDACKDTGSVLLTRNNWDLSWVQQYLATAAAQASSMNSTQLVSVLQVAADLYCGWQQQQLQQQQSQASDAFGHLPVQMPATSAVTLRPQKRLLPQVSCSEYPDWLLPLLQAFQQQLPDMRVNHLAAVLPALATLTVTPWSKEALTPLLLQVRLLLPAASGPDTVSVAAAVVNLGAASEVRDDQDWCNAYLHRLHALMHTLGPTDLATAVSTLSRLRYRPYRAWLYELCGRLRIEVKNMTRDQLVDILEGLSILKVKLDPEVLHMFVLGIKRWLGSMQCFDMVRLVKALSEMYRRPGGRTVLPGRTVQQLVEEMERRIRLEGLQQGRAL